MVCAQLSLRVERIVKPVTPLRVHSVRNGSERLRKRLFLREERLSNAQGRGLCEANAGHAPWGVGGWSTEDVA